MNALMRTWGYNNDTILIPPTPPYTHTYAETKSSIRVSTLVTLWSLKQFLLKLIKVFNTYPRRDVRGERGGGGELAQFVRAWGM